LKQFLSHLLAAIVAVLAPIYALMGAVGFLIMADLVTGVWAAIKRKEKIRSSIMRRVISKICVYNLAVISGFLVEAYMLDYHLPVSKIVASVIGLVELKSILENGNTILGYPLFKSIIARLGSENDELKQEIAEKAKNLVKKQLD